MDHEIRITPHVETRELADLEQRLHRLDTLFKSMAESSGRVKFPWDTHGSGSTTPGGGGGGGGGSPGSASPAGMTAQTTEQQARQAVRARMPQAGRRRSAGAASSGQFLTNFQNIIEPILPQLDALMQQPGGKTSAAGTLRHHLTQVQQVAAHPAGSSAESFALANAAQATGLDPTALAHAAAQYRTTQPTHGAVISAYLRAHAQAQGTGPAGPSAGIGILQRLGQAAGVGEMTGLLGAGAAATGIGAAALGVNFVANQTRQGWSAYRTQGTAFSALSKSLGSLGESFNTLRNQINATSLGFAETMPQITQAFQAMTPYVGNLGTRGLSRMMTASQGFAFGYGLNPAGTAQAFGQAAQIGILPTNSTAGQMAPAQWAALLANAVSAGGMQGRQGQVLSAMLSTSQQIAQQLGQAPNANLLASIMTGLNQSRNPLLQGTMGAQLLGSINQGIQNPGLGSAGALASYQQLNPNGQLGYFQTQFLQAQGLNGINPSTRQSNFSAILQYYQKMLPGGRVTGTTRNGVWMPSEQSAAVSALFGGQLHLTQPQALNVLKAFNGRSAVQENATKALADQLGPQTFQTLLQKGGMGVFAGIANATHVGGAHGLQALAHQIHGSLHGHVSAHFYALEHAYQHLGTLHPTSVTQAQGIQHQRALDFTQMQRTLGKSVLGGPTLGTSMDNLNTAINKANANWAKVARNLQPLVHGLAVLDEALSGFLAGGSAKQMQQSRANNPVYRGRFGAGTAAYTIPGLSSQSGLGATLAGFVQGNQQTTFLSALEQLMSNGSTSGGGSGKGPYGLLGYTPSGAQSLSLTSAVTRHNPQIAAIIGGMRGHSPLLTPALVDSVMQMESGGHQTGPNGQTLTSSSGALGTMQLEPGTAAGLGVNPYNATANLMGGIKYLNQLLQQFGNVPQALSGYNAGAGAVPNQGLAPGTSQYVATIVTLLQKIERNSRQSPGPSMPIPGSVGI